MKKLGLLTSLLFTCLFTLSAQNFTTAAGLRLGVPTSLSIKHFLSEKNALEAYIGTRGSSFWRRTNISGAYQIHNPLDIDGLDGLQWYYGAGLGVFIWNFDSGFLTEETTNVSVGAQGYIGLDYTFANIPLNLSIDWIPTIFFNGFSSGFGGGSGALAARYIFNE